MPNHPNKDIRELFAPFRPKYRDMLIARKSPAPDIEDDSPIGVMLDERDIESDSILFANSITDDASCTISAIRYECEICGIPWGH